MARLRGFYKENVFPAMKDKFSYGNPMKVPRVVKIVVNMGLGEGSRNSSILEAATKDLATITGQKPKITKARISVANFKLRAGMDVGSKVTLRGNQMWEFMDRLVNVALPRVRDFRGVSEKGFDGRGNYNLGIKEQIIFPEIDYDKISRIQGMDVSIVTTAETDEEAMELLRLLNMPFRRN
ncbi:MAG: 50S ribosomal protein L5 [Candidatus Krumholzibacteria bacterium]|jgi:large subunit ribosomal protein L5|nr:50S ribosomal protein L5 [Candidatus Krumholzibacteria bacterium]MDP6797819.1 50S ribosomal protein L5 [Candidatus Krumholzibacteria bacterium]MDP7022062.1 50S ribosomal protein L5 [Candidatus Krumholzibacteria bacterium]